MQYSLNKSFQDVKKSEKKFATLLETVPIGLSVFDASGKIIVVNDAGRKLFGQEVVSAFQQTDFSEIYEVYISSTKQLYTVANFSALQAILGEVRFTNDLEIRRADGKIIPLEVRTTPVLDESGQVVYIINAFTDISEEKEAQKLIADYNRTLAAQVEEKTQALQRSEAQINTFFASAPVGMAIVDRQLRFIKINETLAEIDGVSVKDHLGKEVEEVLEVLGMEVKSLYKEVLLTGQPILNKELCGEVSSTSEFKRYWLVSYFPIFAGDNLVDGVGAIVIEITERKQLEITLEALSAKLNDILNNAAAAITSLRVFPDCQWDINHISSESETVFGYTPAEIKSNQKFWQERIFSEDWQAIEEEIFANIFAERKGTYEYRFYHKNGSLRWISQTNSSRWDCVQNCWIVTVVSLDITDQKLAEEALLESQSSLMEAEKIAHLGNWSFDLISQKIIWSEQAFRIYGIDYCQGEPSYEELLNLTHPDDRELFSGNVQLAVTEGISYEHEVRIIPADGVIRFTFGKGQAVFNKSGKIIKLFGIVQDITERKQVEAELSRAKEAAEAANKAKSSFLANMSHELRTPLNSILGFAQLMLSNSDFSKESQHFLSIINCSGEHLLRLINDVLDMAKIEAGCITINESIFSLYKLLDDLEKLFYLKIKDKKLIFNIYRDANVPESVKTDEIKLRQVLINLIGNAIKFTEVGSVIMRVSIKANYFESMPKKRRILFEIQDTGCGISEKELNKIFDPFSQTRIGKESQEGTGLGLSISRKFIELMGGEISVASKEGYGSIFKFEIDCVIGEYYSLESADKLNEANKKDDGKSEFLSVENYIINPADLQVLPASLLQALEKATVQASLQEIYMVIDEIDAINSHLGSALKSLADVFDYPEILQAVENSKLMGNNYEK
jgi:PAS domain S-box-containing protein